MMSIRVVAETLAMCVAFLCATSGRAEEKPAAQESAAEKLGWRLALQGTGQAGSFDQTVDTAQRLGFKYVALHARQLPFSPTNERPGAIEAIKEKLRRVGVKLVCFEDDGGGLTIIPTGHGMAKVYEPSPDADRIPKLFEFANKLGIEIIDAPFDLKSAPDMLPGIEKLCVKYNVKLALRAGLTFADWSPERALAVAKDFSKHIGVSLRADGGAPGNPKPAECISQLQLEDRLLLLSLQDCATGRSLQESHRHGSGVPWGAGTLDVKGILTELKRQGFRGVIVMRDVRSVEKEREDNLRKSKEYFEKIAEELLSAEKK